MNAIPINFQILIDSVQHIVKGSSVAPSLAFEDEQRVFKFAIYHHLIPWLWALIDEIEIGSSRFRRDVAYAMRQQEIRSQLQIKEYLTLSSAFNDAGVQHLIFKGLCIEKHFYRNFVDQRFSSDMDILIHPNNLFEAVDVLFDSGYRLRQSLNVRNLATFLDSYNSLYRWRDIGLQKANQGRECIDLHWRIYDEFMFPVDTQFLLNNAETMKINNAEISCLPFTIQFVHACVHAHADYFFCFRHIVDIYCATQQPDFNLDEVIQVANTWGVMHVVEDSMEVVDMMFNSVNVVNQYAQKVSSRYHESQGFPSRSHPNKGEWSVRDKWQHLQRQMQNRSRNCSWWTPLLARCKYNQNMIDQWPNTISPIVWYPVAIASRLWR